MFERKKTYKPLSDNATRAECIYSFQYPPVSPNDVPILKHFTIQLDKPYLSFQYDYISYPAAEKFNALLCKNQGFDICIGSGPKIYYFNISSTPSTTHEQCKGLVDILLECALIDNETQSLLLRDINYVFKVKNLQALLANTAKTNLPEAKTLALEMQNEFSCENAVWEFAEHLHAIGLGNDALEMYQEIPEENSNYKKTFKAMIALIQEVLFANEDPACKTKLSPAECQEYRENLLRLSLKGGDVEFSQRMFYDLSGLGLREVYPTINTDAETLISVARITSEVIKENLQLKAKLKSLEKEVAPSSKICMFKP